MALTKYAAYSADGDLNAHVQNYTAGGTFAPGDVVKFSSGTIVVAAENDAKALDGRCRSARAAASARC